MGTGRLIDIKSSKLVNARTRHLLKGNVKVTLIKHVYPKSRKRSTFDTINVVFYLKSVH